MNVRVNQPFVDETGVSRIFIAKQQDPPEVTPMPADASPYEEARALQGGEGVGNTFLGNNVACTSAHKFVLTEMIRLEECLRRCEYHAAIVYECFCQSVITCSTDIALDW